MEILSKIEVQVRVEEVIERIKQGLIFIHPTDTIYGLGCDATNGKAVAKLRQLKKRPGNPFSIWAPSLQWIEENGVITAEAKEWRKKLPGPYTLILQLKNKKAVSGVVNDHSANIGVRLPNHWFGRVVEKLGVPIVTTSANKAGEKFMTALENLDPEIAARVDFMVAEGVKDGRPSKIIDLTTGKVRQR